MIPYICAYRKQKELYGFFTGFPVEEERIWIVMLALGLILGYFCGKYGKKLYITLACGAYGVYWLGQFLPVLKSQLFSVPGAIQYGGPLLWFRYGVLFFPIVWKVCMYYFFYYMFKRK